MNKVAILCLLSLMFVQTACAASFDCGKATTKVEKMICADPELSKLDGGLGKLYQDSLDKATEEQKKRLVTEQRHWLKHTRNICKDEPCLKLAYWSRQAGLETFFEPKTPLYDHEADKAEAIKKVLAIEPLYLVEGTEDVPFCTQLFKDLKQMNGVVFIDPAVQTQSYEASGLDEWKKQCGSETPPIHFSYGCKPRVSNYISGYRDAIESTACSKGFGVGPFRIYELPMAVMGGQPVIIFYADSTFGSNVWEYDEIYSEELWERKRPKLGKGYSARFQQISPDKCERVDGIFENFNSEPNSSNFNSIITYKDHHFFLVLNQSNSSWWLKVSAITSLGSQKQKYCRWTPQAHE